MRTQAERDLVLCIVYGKCSKIAFVPVSELNSWLQTIPKEERRCITKIETDLTPAEADRIHRENEIIRRANLEAEEAENRLNDFMKSRKKTA